MGCGCRDKNNTLAVRRVAVIVVAMKEAVAVDAIGMVFIVVSECSEMCKAQRRIP
jgi:hypothetical protein